MGITKQEKTDSYQAVDEDGNTHTVSVFTTFIEASGGWVRGLGEHRMPDGNRVNVRDDGTLEEVRTGRVMRRVN